MLSFIKHLEELPMIRSMYSSPGTATRLRAAATKVTRAAPEAAVPAAIIRGSCRGSAAAASRAADPPPQPARPDDAAHDAAAVDTAGHAHGQEGPAPATQEVRGDMKIWRLEVLDFGTDVTIMAESVSLLLDR